MCCLFKSDIMEVMFLSVKQQLQIILGLVFWYVFGFLLLYVFAESVLPSDIIKYNVIYFIHSSMLFGAIVAFIGSRRLSIQGAIGKASFFIGSALLCNGLGFFTWFVSETLLKETTLYPAPADFFYVLFYFLVSIGLFYLLRVYALNVTKQKLIQAFVLAIISGILMFKIFDLSLPSFAETDSFLKNAFDLFYTFTDVLLIGVVVVTLRLAGGKVFKGLLVFLFGLILTVAADLTFSYRIDNGSYYTGDVGDLLFSFSGLALAIGIFFIVRNFNLSSSNINVAE